MQRAVFRHDDEEAILKEHFRGSAPGYFVEVGAFHPTALSQSHALECAGWDGLLIEPLTEHVRNLRAHRRAKVVQAACGSPSQHGSSLPVGKGGGLSSMKRGTFADYETAHVLTLDSILYAEQRERIDFISIDVEGAELDVLAGFDLDRWRPSLALIEDHIENERIHRHMTAHGYKRVRRTGDNSWYVPKSAIFPLDLLGRWQLFRKYYAGRPIRQIKKRIKECE